MAIGLLAKKVGMTQIFKDDGSVVPVTVLEAGPCTVVQVKTDLERKVPRVDRNDRKYLVQKNDKYNAIQLGFEPVNKDKIAKPLAGHFGNTPRTKRLGKKTIAPMRYLREFRIADPASYQPGDEIKVDIFQIGETVHVTGTSKGRGFMGVVRRHNFKGPRKSHGTHEYFRHGGSIGQHTYPGRVWKGMKMPGQMGNVRVTTHNLAVIKIDPNHNLIFLKGSVPGHTGGLVMVYKVS